MPRNAADIFMAGCEQLRFAAQAADSATSNKKSDFDLSLARSELVRAAAMMQMIKDVRRQVKK